MQPTLSSVHINAALENVAIGYKPSAYVLDTVFPTVPVKKESDSYYTWTQADIRRNEAKIVRPGAKAPRGGFTLSSASYTAEEYKFAWPIPDRVIENMDYAIRAEVSAAQRVMDKILLARERVISTLLTTTGNWTSTAAESGGWNLGAGDPVGVIETGVQSVKNAIGLVPNTMVMDWIAFRALRKHPQMLERLGIGSGTGQRAITANGVSVVNLAVLSEIFDIQRIIVTTANYNTSAEAAATQTYAPVMTDTVWLGYVAPSPAIDEPSAGYVFTVKAPMIRTYREEDPEQLVVEGKVLFDAKATLAAAGYTITNVIQ